MSDAGPIALSLFLQVILLCAGAPLISGIIRKTKARLQHRRGAGIFQPYADLAKLMRKDVIIPAAASWVFRTTPYLVFSSTLVIALLVPTVLVPVLLNPAGDIITVVYLFALGRFFIALAGLDTGGAFGGLGASREMSIASIIEPAMMLAIFTAAVTAGSTNLSTIAAALSSSPASMFNPAHLLAFSGLFIVTMAETGRIPVDNPDTHLELTMIHEAMILEYSGRYMAFIELSSQMKLAIFLALLSNMFFPFGMAHSAAAGAVLSGCAAFASKVLVLAVVVAVVESTNAKLRLFRVPELLMVAFILSLLALILFFIIGA